MQLQYFTFSGKRTTHMVDDGIHVYTDTDCIATINHISEWKKLNYFYNAAVTPFQVVCYVYSNFQSKR